MTKFDDGTVARWKNLVAEGLAPLGEDFSSVTTGVQAWNIAHNLGIVKEAYKDPTVFDAHIQTALEKIFPACVFKDKKRY